MIKVAIRVSPTPFLAEDIAQQAIAEFLQHRDRWEVPDDPRSLLAKITRITATRFWRQWLRNQLESLQKLAERVRQRTEELPEDDDWEDRRDEIAARLQRFVDESLRTGRSGNGKGLLAA